MSTNRNTYQWHFDAEELALERAERVLQLHLPDVIAERDDVDPDATGTNKIFRVPPPEKYYREEEQLERLLRGADIGVQITGQASTSAGTYHSRDRAESGELVKWTLRVGLAFRAPGESWSGLLERDVGRDETQLEATGRIARKYKGAIMSILLEHLPGGAGIVRAKYRASWGKPHELDGFHLIGLAVAQVDVMQAIRIENPKNEVGP